MRFIASDKLIKKERTGREEKEKTALQLWREYFITKGRKNELQYFLVGGEGFYPENPNQRFTTTMTSCHARVYSNKDTRIILFYVIAS